MAAEVLRLAVQDARAGSLEEFRSELGEVCGKVLDAQPAMATLVTLVRDVLTSVEACEDLETGRLAAVRSAEAFGSGFESRAESVATRASALIPSGATVATISYSSTVLATLTHEGTRAVGQVICFESRPMREGEPSPPPWPRSGWRSPLLSMRPPRHSWASATSFCWVLIRSATWES